MRIVSDKSCRENQNTLLFSATFFENRVYVFGLWDNVEKCCRVRQATDDNMAHAHCILDNWAYKHTLRIYNTYCISTATMVTRTRFIVTFLRSDTGEHWREKYFFLTRGVRPPPRCQYFRSTVMIYDMIMLLYNIWYMIWYMLWYNIICNDMIYLTAIG
jgi:hypothetical protein